MDKFLLLLEPVLLHIETKDHPILVFALLIPAVDVSWTA